MAIILCLETATTNCSVALSVMGSVIALKEDNNLQYSHAERLHVFMEEILLENGIDKDQLDAIAVSKGPGSYTGLRIGVSSAKGLCFSLEIPLVSVATLEILASQVSIEKGCVVPMLDARRMEVYSAVYSGDYKEIRSTEAEILDEHSFQQYLKQGPVHFIGNGVDKFKEICNHPNANFVENAFPSAKEMTALAEDKFLKDEFEDVAYFEPYYLKDFIAG